MIGNKSDLREREVTSEEAIEKAKEWNISYLETSAKTGDNIMKILDILLNKMEKDIIQLPAFFFHYMLCDKNSMVTKNFNALSGNKGIRVTTANDYMADSCFYDGIYAGRLLSVMTAWL